MAVHRTQKLTKAGKDLQNPRSSKKTKSKAGKTLAVHKKIAHKK